MFEHGISNLDEVMRARHSVRQYLDAPIPEEVRHELDAYTQKLNEESGLHIQIVYDDPVCFNSRMAHYGRFRGCANYIAMIGKKSADLDEKCGFYGELAVLKAQQLGLNTCWAALTHGKSRAAVGAGEREVILISLGYGATQGTARKSKSPDAVSNLTPDAPDWFKAGVEAALLAPTAVNQQKFFFTREGDKVTARAGRIGSCLKIDLGIVKCHFALAAGDSFTWA